jgi:hypothetical protein
MSDGGLLLRPFPATKKLLRLLYPSHPNSLDVVREIQIFRGSLSIGLVKSIDPPQREAFLTQTWYLLILFAELPDASIRIAVSSAMGGLIFSLSLVDPNFVARGFSRAVRLKQAPSNASILIAGAFLNIVDSLSPSRVTTFVEATPVQAHFTANMSNYVQHFPNLIPLMASLDTSFHCNLIISLLAALETSQNHAAVTPIVTVITLTPAALLEFVLGRIGDPTLLLLMPSLLSDQKVTDHSVRYDMDHSLRYNVDDSESATTSITRYAMTLMTPNTP